MMRRSVWVLVLVAAPAWAVDIGLVGGAIEVLAMPGPEHAGFYPNLAVSFAFPTEKATFIAQVGGEFAPDTLRGGVVVSGTVDFPVHKNLGIDLTVTFIHDHGFQHGDVAFYFGGGPGVSIMLDKVTISPFLEFFLGGAPFGYSLVPGCMVTYAL